jgi:hypothetical protein
MHQDDTIIKIAGYLTCLNYTTDTDMANQPRSLISSASDSALKH